MKKKTQKFKINTNNNPKPRKYLAIRSPSQQQTQPMITDLTNQPITPIIWNPHEQIRPPVTTTVTDLGTTNFDGGGNGRWEASDSDERRGAENDAVYGGVCEKWWYVGGSNHETTGCCEPREHILFDEEVYWEEDEESKQVLYRVVRDENGNVKLDCLTIRKQVVAEEISAQVWGN